jgi:glycosyltransferase involved in cell wall biosynthesis
LDTEATIALREPEAGAPAGQGQGQDADLDAAIAARLASASICRGIVAVSELEAARLRALGLRDVSVIRPIRVPTPTVRRFADRAGLLFAGTIRDIGSPDYASLCWLADEVLPLVKDLLGSEVRLTMAGFMAEGVTLERFRDHPRVSLRGPVPDMTLLYDSHRVFVAPARVAAGTRFEVYEAAAHGLPVVASELLYRQTGWQDGKELLAAPTDNAKLFAQQIVALYVDRARWQRVRDAALARLAAENGRERCVAALRGLLD